MARFRPLIESWSTSRTTGTIKPVVDGDRDAHVDTPLRQHAVLGPVRVERRIAPQRIDGGLDHERDVAERDPLPSLVVALRAFADAHQVGHIDLHVDVRVRHGSSARVICAAIPLRILVIGSRTSSAPSGNSIGAPTGRAGPAAVVRRVRPVRRLGAAEPFWPDAGAAAASRRWGGAAGPDRLDDLEDVLAGDSATAAGADDLGRGQLVFAQEPTHRRASSARPGRPSPGGRHRGRRLCGAALIGGQPVAGRWAAARRRGPGPLRGALRPGPPPFAASVAAGAASGAAAAAAVGAAGASAPEPASSAVSMTAISALLGTTEPSSARISRRMPSNGDGTSALTLSVTTSTRGSYLAT